VVVDGQYKLQPGSKVRPAEAPGSKPSGSKTNVASSKKSADNGKSHRSQNEDEAAN
jgi:hypothetical protein